MSRSLGIIPSAVPIVDRAGAISLFFRERWQELVDGFTTSPTLATVAKDTQTAALVTTTLVTTPGAGRYRVSWYLRKTIADGVASSLTVTIGWLDHAAALTASGAALTTDTTAAQQSGSMVVNADAVSAITYAVAYASTTPNKMTFNAYVTVERLVGS